MNFVDNEIPSRFGKLHFVSSRIKTRWVIDLCILLVGIAIGMIWRSAQLDSQISATLLQWKNWYPGCLKVLIDKKTYYGDNAEFIPGTSKVIISRGKSGLLLPDNIAIIEEIPK
jgi:hypothetical protein